MSKAQELKQRREANRVSAAVRAFQPAEDAETLDSYYEKILSNEEIEKAIMEYEGHYNDLTEEFLERTRLQKADLGFLFFAIMLQCGRIILMNNLTELEKANEHGGKEDKLHEFQNKVLGKFSNGDKPETARLHASLDAIILTRGVPYDATGYFDDSLKKLKLFKGANHRFSTMGHDPVLGLLFGTANILTNTITTNKRLLLSTNHVIYDNQIKNPRIGTPVPTSQMLSAAFSRVKDDKKSVVAAVIKQLIHIATDLYTPCGITLPGAGLVLSNANVEKLTQYVSTGDIIKASASAEMAILINTIIATIHGCSFLLEDDGSNLSSEMHQARTKKILMYSNVIASSSNIIATIISKDVKQLDIGGLGVTIYRLFADTIFIRKLEYEFINSGLNQIYREKIGDLDGIYFD